MQLHREPRTPTLVRDRLPAVRAYVEAEQLCDAGSSADGIKKFQHAYRLAWELELEAWPGWAAALHRQLLAGAEPSGPPDPPCVNRGTGWLFPALCAERAAGPVGEWWRRASALDAVGAALARKHFAILDDFAPAAELHAACAAAWRDGALHPARVAAPGDGPTATSRRAASRSDHIAWVDPQEWTPLRDVVGRMDELIRLLRAAAPAVLQADGAELSLSRMRPMVSRYGEGDLFARHCDNHCSDGRGPYCNGRLLSAVFYTRAADDEWREGDGGCLRVYRPQADPATGDTDGGDADDGDDAVADIAPLGGRLLLFFSDFRVPHEVLPVRRGERFAATCWYLSGERAVGTSTY